MKRYALSTIIGTGTDDDPFRAKVADYPVNWVIAIAPDQETNTAKQWVLVVLGGTQTQIDAMTTDPAILILPFGPGDLDTSWLSIGTNAQRNTFASGIRSRTGVSVTRDDPRTLREIVTALGTTLDPNFNAANLNVSE